MLRRALAYLTVDAINAQKTITRWIVERTISWLNWSRRLSKDYEQTRGSAEAWIDVSAIRCALRKLEPF